MKKLGKWYGDSEDGGGGPFSARGMEFHPRNRRSEIARGPRFFKLNNDYK